MALCERCSAEIAGPAEQLPEWLDSHTHCVLVGEERRYLHPAAWRLLVLLWHRRSRIVAMESMVRLMWPGPNGGPPTAEATARVYATRVRSALRGTGYTVLCANLRGYYIGREDEAPTRIGAIEPGLNPDEPQPQPFANRYPFHLMGVGQSFFVFGGDLYTVKASCRYANRVRHLGGFDVDEFPKGVRVTKTADADLT
jgi:DNA-binding winged helix-turn-helix (wHTH) protein